jgi:hypothetical protein
MNDPNTNLAELRKCALLPLLDPLASAFAVAIADLEFPISSSSQREFVLPYGCVELVEVVFEQQALGASMARITEAWMRRTRRLVRGCLLFVALFVFVLIITRWATDAAFGGTAAVRYLR